VGTRGVKPPEYVTNVSVRVPHKKATLHKNLVFVVIKAPFLLVFGRVSSLIFDLGFAMIMQANRPTILVDRRGTRFHENDHSDSKDVSDVVKLRTAKNSSEVLPG